MIGTACKEDAEKYLALVLEAIDKTFEQMVPATELGACKYRTSSGEKCIVGNLIADEFYGKDLEGAAAMGRHVIAAVHSSTLVNIDSSIGYAIQSVQEMHDECMEYEKSYIENREKIKAACIATAHAEFNKAIEKLPLVCPSISQSNQGEI